MVTELNVRSDQIPFVSGLAVASARSNGIGTVPGSRSDIDGSTVEDLRSLSKRQRKRKRDTYRKNKLCKKALDFEEELKEAKQESKKIKEDLMILKTQKGLLARYIYIYISELGIG